MNTVLCVLPIDEGAVESEFEDKVVELLLELCACIGRLVLAGEDVGVVHAALVPSRHRRGEEEESALNGGGRADEKIQSRVLP